MALATNWIFDHPELDLETPLEEEMRRLEAEEEEAFDEDDEDVYTLSKLGDLIHALFSTHKEDFLPVFDQLLPFTSKLLVSPE